MSAYMAVGNSHVESMDFLLDEIRKTNNQLELDKAKAKGKVCACLPICAAKGPIALLDAL